MISQTLTSLNKIYIDQEEKMKVKDKFMEKNEILIRENKLKSKTKIDLAKLSFESRKLNHQFDKNLNESNFKIFCFC